MKKILIIISLFISMNVFAEDAEMYQQKLNTCDANYDKTLENKFKSLKDYYESAESVKLNYDLRDCYEKVAHEVIDSYYKKESNSMKSKLDNISKAAYDLNSDIQNLNDFCYGNCGKVTSVIYTEHTARIYKQFVQNMINVVEFRK